MIPFRSRPFSDHALSFIDGACDQGEITLATAIALKLHGDPDAVDAALPPERTAEEAARLAREVERRVGVRLWTSRRPAACMALARMAEEIIGQLEPRRRGAIIQAAYPHLVQNLASLAQVYACWAFEDSRRGGCLLPWRKRWLCRRDGRPTPKLARRLRSPSWIARYVRRADANTIGPFRELCRHFLSMRDRWAGSGAEADAMALTEDLERVEAACRQGRQPAAPKSTRRLLAGAWRDRQAARRVMKRGAAAAAAVVGAAAVGAFARGEFVELEGERAVLAVRRGEGASLLDFGHGALDVRLLDRQRRRVADLCVYLQSTPIIDHLAGMALHVQSGGEGELIAAANVVRVHAPGHELLPARKVVERPAAAGRQRHPHFSGSYDEERALQDEYWRASQRLWIEAVGAHCMGRDWKLRRFFAGAD